MDSSRDWACNWQSTNTWSAKTHSIVSFKEIGVKTACHSIAQYDWDDTSHMICPMILYALLENTDRGSYDRAENGMLCCNRSNDQPIFLVGWAVWGKTRQKWNTKPFSRRLTLGRNTQPLNRRICRSCFLYLDGFLFFGDFLSLYFSFRLPQGYEMTDKSDFSPSKWPDHWRSISFFTKIYWCPNI